MATNYPGAIDTYTNPLSSEPMNAPSHAGQHANANDAVEAIETELGTDPSGSAATVKARLDGIEDGTRLGANSVGATQIANDSVGTAAIQSKAVTAAKIADDTITAAQIAANAVGSSELADNAVDTAAIADGAVTAVKILIGAATVGSGTGTPEGVVTAAPGSTWLQTDSTTDVKGWIRWVKATGTGNTGWVAGPEADTGWRDVTASVTGTASGSLHIRRTANVVTLRFISLELNSGSGPVSLCTFATGFKVITSALGALRRQFDQTKLQHIWVDPTDVSWQAEYGSVAWTTTHPTGAGSGMTGVITHTTTDDWPLSLPGVAV